MGRRVVVTGLGLICGVGNSTAEVWQGVLAGKSGVGRITHFDASNFACQIAAEVKNFDPLNYIEKKEVKKMSRFIHFALAASDEAMKMSGKMNLSLQQVGGSVLAVSQFTLYGDVRRGKRPSFDAAAPPEKALQLYEFFVDQIRKSGVRCETGRFQAEMEVNLTNEGPVTILLDSSKVF